MKKLLFMTLGATALLATSCSNDEGIQTNVNNGPVEIELDATTYDVVATKTPIMGDQFEDGTQITVLGLAKPANALSSWTQEYASAFSEEGTTSNTNKGITATVTSTGIDFDKTYYYPISPENGATGFQYTFFASYPAGEWNVTSNSASKTFAVDGKTDYLFACAEVENGYNAKYFRPGEGVTVTKPELVFNHLMTMLRFHIQPGEGADVSASDLTNAVVTEITVDNLPSQIGLTINRAETMKGTEIINDNNAIDSDPIALLEIEENLMSQGEDDKYTYHDETAGEEYIDTNEAKLFGYIIVPPTSAIQNSSRKLTGEKDGYKLSVTLKKNTPGAVEDAPITVELDGKFEPNKIYDIYLKVYGYRQISFEVPTITPWDEADNSYNAKNPLPVNE